MTTRLLRIGAYAGAAKEQVSNPPEIWVNANRWALASAPSWAEKVDYWIASNPDADPANGWATDPTVITDDDIIAQIQFLVTPPVEIGNELPEVER